MATQTKEESIPQDITINIFAWLPVKSLMLVGFKPNENKYKVLLTMNMDISEGLSRAWVFTLGIDKSWREIKNEHGYHLAPHRSGICISGIIYRFNFAPEYSVVAFDVKSETFRSIELSLGLHNSIHSCKYDYMLIEVNEKLAILNFIDWWCTGDIDLWIFLGDSKRRVGTSDLLISFRTGRKRPGDILKFQDFLIALKAFVLTVKASFRCSTHPQA
ncbi:hypothetical protein RND71_027552 [Anisodus tanguticus]|uniref:F-box associated beta-propeller type 3 domain-containing protein n=1 Tax=Anisodus tanguticus TaxID=243964 RepID=A0AAE1RGU8_9SOLA|nr:hypothetical protein RND71_027552 [Anisodus tanguticus]